MVLFHLLFLCAQPFDQKLGSSLIHFFYVDTTIRPKYVIPIHLFLLCARPFEQKLGSSLIYFFYLHTTIRQKYMTLFHLFFLCARPFDQQLSSSLIYFFCLHSIIRQKIYGPLSFILSLCTTIWPKIRILINLFLLFVHDHSTKIRGHSYSLIYFFLNCANILFAVFMAVRPLYFVLSNSDSAAFIFCLL